MKSPKVNMKKTKKTKKSKEVAEKQQVKYMTSQKHSLALENGAEVLFPLETSFVQAAEILNVFKQILDERQRIIDKEIDKKEESLPTEDTSPM